MRFPAVLSAALILEEHAGQTMEIGIAGIPKKEERRTRRRSLGKTKKTKSAMLQLDNPETTDGERHRP
ncbi:MAG TPA: hypothetical protein DDY78_03585, partial [Planctomycetales bacterium]|nr:hypothetical protein [Planctomycetales bacterium]